MGCNMDLSKEVLNEAIKWTQKGVQKGVDLEA